MQRQFVAILIGVLPTLGCYAFRTNPSNRAMGPYMEIKASRLTSTLPLEA